MDDQVGGWRDGHVVDGSRASVDRAAEHARNADEAATNAENYAKDTETRANNVAQVSRDIQAQLAQIQEQLRLENEARQRQEVEQVIRPCHDNRVSHGWTKI
ncbi:hypothetical protein, partial [Amycolatopsis regifaucium]